MLFNTPMFSLNSTRKIFFSNYIVHPFPLVKKVLSNFVWNITTQEKILYLTFDDGPIPNLSEKIISLLKEYQAEATFFCVGDNVAKYPEVYQKIISEGHSVGNHTYSHLNGWLQNTNDYIENVEKCSEFVQSTLFRPPYGKIKPAQQNILRKKYLLIMWDVLTRDYDSNISPKQCFANVDKYAKPGSIIVFHDNLKAEQNMLYTLNRTLKEFSEKGYIFKKLTDEVVRSSIVTNGNKMIPQ